MPNYPLHTQRNGAIDIFFEKNRKNYCQSLEKEKMWCYNNLAIKIDDC